VPFVVGTKREVSESRRGEMKPKRVFYLHKFNLIFFFLLKWTTPRQQGVDAGWTNSRCVELLELG
jgi:hypothetical protein